MTCLPLERTHQRRAPAHAPQGAARLIAELGEVARAEVGKLVMFPVTPDVFHRIEFRGVTRQPLDREPAPLRADKLGDQPRPVLRQPVPNHQESAWQVTQQMAEEVDHLRGADGAGVEAEVEVLELPRFGGQCWAAVQSLLQSTPFVVDWR